MPDPSVERFRRVVEAASAYLEARRDEVNDLNVFPVADGDTGDNMALTMRAVLAELDRIEAEGGEEADRNELVHAVARAALMGARGNSGVILSQIVRGAAEELATRPGELIDPVLVSAALARAADAAYESVRNPAEGTMLTVVRAMALAAAKHLARLSDDSRRIEPGFGQERQDKLLAEVLEVVTVAGEQAVQRTTGQLKELDEAGVVDAGAHGLVLILAGIVAGLRNEDTPQIDIPEQAPARLSAPQHSDSRYQYCVNFIVLGEGLEADEFEAPLRDIGDSVLVVGDRRTLRVHVHTDEPGRAREVFEGRGIVQQVDEADMRAQMTDRADRAERANGIAAADRCAVVAVASGDGMRHLFEDLGATVVDGGPTMNPSTDELLAGIHAVDAECVLVLPNSPNVVLAAQHAVELSEREAHVVDCTSQQAGLAALVEHDPAAGIDVNLERLDEAVAGVRVGAVAPAARDDAEGRFVRGDVVGFVGGEIAAWGGAGSTLSATIAALTDDAEIITIIEGEGAPIPLDELTGVAPPGIDAEVHHGGQPHYWWLLAAQ
ncbi:MAG: DAK2 domain-containing protein [Solirubrobacterales bacterium]|nr:DAK2 domain-containing protein [Solirubrobacterales bacterium]